MGDYHIEDIYQGGYSSLNPGSGNYFTTGYRIPAGKIGMATDPRTANIINEVSTKLQSGAKQIEVSTIQPDVFESIPKEHFKEINRLSKLTGVDISVHAPLIEPSGFSQQGGYSEFARQEAERQMLSAVEKSHEMSPNGNVPVTFHSSVGWQGAEWAKVKEGKNEIWEKARIPIINQERGDVAMAKQDEKYYPGIREGEAINMIKRSAEKQIENLNQTEWENSITDLVAIKERADRMIHETEPMYHEILNTIKSGGKETLTPSARDVVNRYQNAGLELENIRQHLNDSFSKAYKYGDEETKMKLKEVAGKFKDELAHSKTLSDQSRAFDSLMRNLLIPDSQNGKYALAPEIYKPLEDFAVDKTATTFANVAFNSYKKFKNDAPIISIENPPVGGGLSRAEDLNKLVNNARKKFIENATASTIQGGLGMSEKEAEMQANKLIGVTWDVGHINMMRKYGYSEQEVVRESEKIAPLVKHVHLSDNFGFEHTELPMGMGNVPIKEIMEKLGQKGFDARKVIEAGNWWQHFKTAPFQETLEAFGSPIYGIKMQPYWNQAVGVQGYYGGYGQMLPQGNYEIFGSGFSMLPAELGGQRQGSGRSRMSGSPME